MAVQVEQLITEHLDLWTQAQTAKSTSGRGSNNKIELTGIKKLRELILELAVRGKLVPQDPTDEPASELLKRIADTRNHLTLHEGLKTFATEVIDANEPYLDVPDTWEWIRLGNLAKFIDYRGKTPVKTSSGIKLITAKNIRPGYIDSAPEEFIAECDYDGWMLRGIPKRGDLLFTTEAPLGNAAIVDIDFKFALAQRTICFQWHEISISKFMLLSVLSQSFQTQLSLNANGMTATGIKSSKLKEIPVALPPLEEQLRIVAKVDELMALCDQLERQSYQQLDAHNQLVDALLATLTQSQNADELASNWQRLAEHFDALFTTEYSINALKQTILQLAVMGKLCKQDPNDEPASELLKRIAAEKDALVKAGKIKKQKTLPPISDEEKPYELPEGWEWCRLSEITDIQSGIAKGKRFNNRQDVIELPYLRVANVQRGYLRLDEIKKIEILRSDIEKYSVICRDLLITEGGDWDKVGRTAVWTGFEGVMLHQNHVFKARVLLDEQNELWLEKYLNGPQARSYFAGSSKQTTNLASINKTQLSNTLVPIPPVNEQIKIVEKLAGFEWFLNEMLDRFAKLSSCRALIAESLVVKLVE